MKRAVERASMRHVTMRSPPPMPAEALTMLCPS
jgi:hypothetical protein